MRTGYDGLCGGDITHVVKQAVASKERDKVVPKTNDGDSNKRIVTSSTIRVGEEENQSGRNRIYHIPKLSKYIWNEFKLDLNIPQRNIFRGLYIQYVEMPR